MQNNTIIDDGKIPVIRNKLIEIFERTKVPDKEPYMDILDKVNITYEKENRNIRPYDSFNLPGGLLNLKKDIPTIIVPDIHARVDFLLNLFLFKDSDNISVLGKLSMNRIQVVCVGDGFHAEIRAIDRWKKAFVEYKNSYQKHKNMDDEMRESLGVMEMIMAAKINFPDNFHFLKGNHENISNENKEGNYPFRKFTYEGQMVLDYVLKFYGNDFLNKYYKFEKNFPLFAIGKNFLISHAEPLEFYNREDIIEYRKNPDLIKGFTWTDNDVAEDGSVQKMLNFYLNPEYSNSGYYFGGHRPIINNFNLRAGGRYVQIHNPSKFIIAYIKNDRNINLDNDIVTINDNTRKILSEYN